MQSVLFDTSIYIAALRRRNDAAIALRRLAADAPVWLSSVVLQELYTGARGNHVTAVQRLERDFDRAKRILVPCLSDWSQAGRVLARLADQYDYELIGRGRIDQRCPNWGQRRSHGYYCHHRESKRLQPALRILVLPVAPRSDLTFNRPLVRGQPSSLPSTTISRNARLILV